MTVYLWHLSVLIIAFLALFGLGVDPPTAGSGLWWLTRPFWLLALALGLAVLATLLSPLERGRASRAATNRPRPHRDKGSRSPTTTNLILQTLVSGVGAALASFGLLGYVASGLQPAPLGSSMLLFVPVDPVQNTVFVFVGFALSSFASSRSRRSP